MGNNNNALCSALAQLAQVIFKRNSNRNQKEEKLREDITMQLRCATISIKKKNQFDLINSDNAIFYSYKG